VGSNSLIWDLDLSESHKSRSSTTLFAIFQIKRVITETQKLRFGNFHLACQVPNCVLRSFEFYKIANWSFINRYMNSIRHILPTIFLISKTHLHSNLLENLKHGCTVLQSDLEFFPRLENPFRKRSSLVSKKAQLSGSSIFTLISVSMPNENTVPGPTSQVSGLLVCLILCALASLR